MLTALLNPWVLLGALLAGLGLFVAGYSSNHTSDAVQAAWDRANTVATQARQARIDKARSAQDALQAAADKERNESNEREAVLTARVGTLLQRLRNRPERPAKPTSGAVVPKPADAGTAPARGCTGADLYRGDGEFLTRFAAGAVRIKSERDLCYSQYERAAEKLRQLNLGGATGATAAGAAASPQAPPPP